MNKEHLAALLACAALAGSAACSRPAPAWPITVSPVTTPAGANSSEPQLTVSDKGIILSWIEQSGQSTATLKFAERTASGWTPAATVASGNQWFVSYADPPHVIRRPDGTLLANWMVATDPILEGSDLNLTYSKDNGKTWAAPILPHHDSSMAQHEFPAFFDLPNNGLGLVWLDGRAVADSPNDPEKASMALRYAAFDSSWKQVADTVIDNRTCDCCSTTAVATADGELIAYRDRSDKEIRDIAVSRFENGKWTEPVHVHDDNWEVFSCPVNGPMVSARGRDVAVAWFTAKGDKGESWAAFSKDAGRTWGQPIRLDDASSLGRVGVELLEDGSAIASWVEYADNRGQFKMRRIQSSGMRGDAIAVAPASAKLAMDTPRMALHGKELVFAWTESCGGESDSAFQVRTAITTVP